MRAGGMIAEIEGGDDGAFSTDTMYMSTSEAGTAETGKGSMGRKAFWIWVGSGVWLILAWRAAKGF